MRPIERGDAPRDRGKNPIAFSTYRDARDHLIDRIGDFCSYCEVALHGPAPVEHVQPKIRRPDLELTWTNCLLACDNCNATKGHANVLLDRYFWPDLDNTARAFVYEVDQPPQVAGGLSDGHREIAARTLHLVGLDRRPGHPKFSKQDRRWLKRKEAWGMALHLHQQLRVNDTPQMRESIAGAAVSRGFWSVWMQVFEADIDMRRRLISWFAGTAHDCFDGNTQPVPRPGGRI